MPPFLLNLAVSIRRCALRLLKVKTRGVRVMAFNAAGELLLIRHRYGDTELYRLPGGGAKRAETPEEAARRELAEETNCVADELRLIGRFPSVSQGWRDTVYLFEGRTDDAPRPDGFEVAEAGFFALDALPANTSPAARRRLAERAGLQGQAHRW